MNKSASTNEMVDKIEKRFLETFNHFSPETPQTKNVYKRN